MQDPELFETTKLILEVNEKLEELEHIKHRLLFITKRLESMLTTTPKGGKIDP